MKMQRGGFVLGMVVGLLVGLALALGVALYITRAPNPFVNKVPPRTAEQDNAEAERNRHWDPNAPLGGKAVARQAAAASATAAATAAVGAAPAAPAASVGAAVALPAPMARSGTPVEAPASMPSPGMRPAVKDPAAILAGSDSLRSAVDPFVYFVQAGAFSRSDEAEQQRARLAIVGQTARITEREQAGRTVYRVRMGPFTTRDQADMLQARLQESSIEAQIVRVERP